MNHDQGEKRGCFGKWFACGCGGCLLLCLGLILLVVAAGGAAYFGISKSGPYAEALDRARSNPQLIDEIGEPIELGFMPTGTIDIEGSHGEVDLTIPVSGPRGKATLRVVGVKTDGIWEYSTLEAEIADSGHCIDLQNLVLEKIEPGPPAQLPDPTPLPERMD